MDARTGQSRDRERAELYLFSPLPPARNGIADYAYKVIDGLRESYDVVACCDSPFAEAPDGVPIIDEAFAFQHLPPDARIVHQIGNNPGHVFVLRAALRYPGVVVLHDPSLLFLHQVAEIPSQDLYDLMIASNPRAARSPRAERRTSRGVARTDHLLFDVLPEILRASRAIVVHSHYTRQLIRLRHGEAAAAKVSVIPHFAYPSAHPSREAARAAVGLDPNAFVVVTAGFVHRRKRYEWLAEALERVVQASARPVIWVQAGELRDDEVPFAELLDRYPAVRGISRVTGYLTESGLDTYIAAADVLVNLRFPSEGESSGSLARAFGAGVCCLVSDTASFGEIPSDVAVKIPTMGAPDAIAAALSALSADPALRDAFGRRAADYAATELSMARYTSRLAAVIEGAGAPAAAMPAATPPEPAAIRLSPDPAAARPRLRDLLAAHPEGVDIVLGPIPAETNARPLLAALLPDRAEALQVRVRPLPARDPAQDASREASYEIRLRLCRETALRHAGTA